MRKFAAFAAAMLIFAVSSFAQSVTGVVTDKATGEALMGVSILVKGTSNGVETDLDGKFSIPAKPGDALVFFYMGYKDLEIAIDKASKLNVQMEADNVFLDEIVVVGYGTQKKAMLQVL